MVGKGKLYATGEERIEDSASPFFCASVLCFVLVFLSDSPCSFIHLFLLSVLTFSSLMLGLSVILLRLRMHLLTWVNQIPSPMSLNMFRFHLIRGFSSPPAWTITEEDFTTRPSCWYLSSQLRMPSCCVPHLPQEGKNKPKPSLYFPSSYMTLGAVMLNFICLHVTDENSFLKCLQSFCHSLAFWWI